MEGYDFITAVDGRHWGTVVGRQGDYVIVEHGMLRKHRYAVPETSVEVDDAERAVRTSLSADLIGDSPKVDDGNVDRYEVAAHYGLAETSEAPATEGWGETVATDPAVGAEAQAERDGVETAVEQRARVREDAGSDMGGIPDESPAMLGERYSDFRRKDDEES